MMGACRIFTATHNTPLQDIGACVIFSGWQSLVLTQECLAAHPSVDGLVDRAPAGSHTALSFRKKGTDSCCCMHVRCTQGALVCCTLHASDAAAAGGVRDAARLGRVHHGCLLGSRVIACAWAPRLQGAVIDNCSSTEAASIMCMHLGEWCNVATVFPPGD